MMFEVVGFIILVRSPFLDAAAALYLSMRNTGRYYY